MNADDNLKYEIATQEHSSILFDFLMDHFVKDEPISRAVGLKRQNGSTLFKEIIEESLQKPVTLICIDQRLKSIVACCLNVLVEKTEQLEKNEDTKKDANLGSVEKKIEDFLDVLATGLSDFLPDCKSYMKFNIVCVDEKYQRRGIARQLLDKSYALARESGCRYGVALATAYKSQQMFSKMGYTLLKTVPHDTYLDEYGQRVFCCDDGTDSGMLFCLKLM